MSQIVEIIKRDWKTIPNFLSYFRLLLIPLFIWLYIGKGEYYFAAAVIVVSGLTDIADGFIARHFNMVSDFGKALDPVADKLTQIAIFICLAERYRLIVLFICVLVVKELIMLFLGMSMLRKTNTMNSAKWYGKLTTFVIEATALILVLVPEISLSLANIMICLCIALVLFSLVMYIRRHIKIISNHYDEMEM
jgi:cardiolipin synthase